MFVILLAFLSVSLLMLLISIITPVESPLLCLVKPTRKVTICIAARDEEGNMKDCLDSLLKLNYPEELLDIRVIDDDSSDRTLAIMKKYAQKYNHINVYQVDQIDMRSNGKIRALAQLTQGIETDFIAFTDADVEVEPNWLLNMVSGIGSYDMISGTTLVKGNGVFTFWQSIDWFYGQLQLSLFTRYIGRTVTVMGNNMLVNNRAFQLSGGYNQLDFSVTEDVALQKKFEENGFKTKLLFGSEYVVYTKPEQSWKALSRQRFRWANALKGLPFLLLIVLSVQNTFLTLLLVLGFVNTQWMLIVLFLKLFLTVVLLAQNKVNAVSWSLFSVLTFGFYQNLLAFYLLKMILFREKVVWKKRLF